MLISPERQTPSPDSAIQIKARGPSTSVRFAGGPIVILMTVGHVLGVTVDVVGVVDGVVVLAEAD